MPVGRHILPTYVIIKNIHMNNEAITNAKIIIDVSRLVGDVNDFKFALSNDSGSTYVEATNNVSVTFGSSGVTNVLYAKIFGKPGKEILIEHATSGKSFPIQIRYNEVI